MFKNTILIFGISAFIGISGLGSVMATHDAIEKNAFENIKNIEQDPETQFTLEGTYVEYKIKDMEVDKSYYSLWKYDSNKKPVLMAKSKVLDFLACKENGNIAVLAYKTEASDQKKEEPSILKVMDKDKNILFDKNLYSEEFSKFLKENDINEKLGYINLYLKGWSDDGKYLWVEAFFDDILFRIDTTTKKVDIIDRSYAFTDDELNYNTGWACASNYPEMYDIYDFDQMKKENTEIELQLVNVLTGETIELATKNAAKFHPRWIDDNSVMYQDSKGDWLVYKLK